MSLSLRIWWRSTWWVLPTTLVLQLLVMRNVQSLDDSLLPGWRLDWGWMLGVWNGGTLLISSFMASVAAMVMVRHWPHELRQQLAPLPKSRTVLIHLVTVLYAQALVAMLIVLGIAAVVCYMNQASMPTATLPWQLFTGPAALLAAVMLGIAFGTLFGDLVLIPLLGFGVMLAHRIFYWQGYPELFTTEIPTVSAEGARPMPLHLLSTIALNLVVALGLWFFVDWLNRVPGMRSRWLLVASVICLVAALAIYLPWVFFSTGDTYEYIP